LAAWRMLKLGLPAICLETQHVRAALKAQRNKTDKADALGIAHIMRTGWFRKAHIKSQPCYRLRLLLTRFKRKDKVKTWGLTIARRAGHRKAVVAVARKLAVIMHAMWCDGTVYCGDPSASAADVAAHAMRKERNLLRVPA
jgi:transposase